MNRLCFIGASTTEGMGDNSRKGWVGNLADTLVATHVCYNLGVRGQTIFQITERAGAECRARILRHNLGGVILGAPLNELARLEDGTPRAARDDVLRCYNTLLSALRDVAGVIVVGPPPVEPSRMPFFSAASGLSLNFLNSDIASADSDLQHLCAERDIPYISVFAHLSKNEEYRAGLLKNDGLHSDIYGYQAMSTFVLAEPAWREFVS
jgi:acyl-CoA thioesterase-1